MYGGRMRGSRGRSRRSPKDPDEEDLPQLTLRQLARVLRPYFWPDGALNRFRAVMCFFILGCSKTANILAPIFIGRAINKLSEENRVPVADIVAYCSLAFLAKGLRELQNYTYLRVQQTAYIDLARTTFRHLHSLSLDWHLSRRTGKVLRSMDRGINSANSVVRFLFLYLVPTLVECLAVCVVFITEYDSLGVAVAVFSGVALYCVVTYFMALWRARIRERMNNEDNDSHDKAVDSLVNFETVKYFTNEEYELDRYTSSLRKFQSAAVSTQASLNLLNTTQQLIIQTVMVVSLLLVARSITQGDLRIGDFTAITVYIMQVFQPLSFLGTIYNAVVQAVVDMRNLSELLAQQPNVTDREDAKPLNLTDTMEGPSIEFRDVRFRYPKQAEGSGIRGISFRVPAGGKLAIVGQTGAGKSTVSRLLFRFYDVDEGQILIGGNDVRDLSQASLRSHVGIVPQDCVLFNDTIGYNIRYGRPDATEEEVHNAADDAQIVPFIKQLDKGYDTRVGERGLKLSGGEKQRVAIARTLIKNPPILVLDEATSSLDTITEQAISGALHRVRRGRTTILIAHRLSTVMDADEIVVLDKGQIVERGSHQALLSQGGYYANMWAQQSARDDGAPDESVSTAAKPAAGLEALDGTQTGVARDNAATGEAEEEEEAGKQESAPVLQDSAAAGAVGTADVSAAVSGESQSK